MAWKLAEPRTVRIVDGLLPAITVLEYSLCDFSFNCWAAWLDDFQALVAGILAICAGGLAYLGATRQARAAEQQALATTRAAVEQRAEAQRAAAAAFWAELNQCYLHLRVLEGRITRLARTLMADATPLEVVRTPVFDSNPASVGLLPADDAYAVLQAYTLIGHVNRDYHDHVERRRTDSPDLHDLEHSLKTCADAIKFTLDRMWPTTGLERDKADAVVEMHRELDRRLGGPT